MAGKGNPKTGGRLAGTPNKVTRSVRDAILCALADLDAYLLKHARWEHGYLVWLGVHDPRAYAALLGKALPREFTFDGAAVVTIRDYTGGAASGPGEGECKTD